MTHETFKVSMAVLGTFAAIFVAMRIFWIIVIASIRQYRSTVRIAAEDEASLVALENTVRDIRIEKHIQSMRAMRYVGSK